MSPTQARSAAVVADIVAAVLRVVPAFVEDFAGVLRGLVVLAVVSAMSSPFHLSRRASPLVNYCESNATCTAWFRRIGGPATPDMAVSYTITTVREKPER